MLFKFIVLFSEQSPNESVTYEQKLNIMGSTNNEVLDANNFVQAGIANNELHNSYNIWGDDEPLIDKVECVLGSDSTKKDEGESISNGNEQINRQAAIPKLRIKVNFRYLNLFFFVY